jgi:hypothetical protein
VNGQVDGGAGDRIELHGADADTVIGDSFTPSAATASGGGDDRIIADNGDGGFVVGDSLSIAGNTSGAGKDRIDDGEGARLIVGDGYAPGAGIATDGAADVIRAGDKDDTLRGDHTQGDDTGGGRDRLFGEGGPDDLVGGPKSDLCDGGGGADLAAECEDEKSIP